MPSRSRSRGRARARGTTTTTTTRRTRSRAPSRTPQSTVTTVVNHASKVKNSPYKGVFKANGLTHEGTCFLKCAYASPDFAVDPGRGIPDRYNGRTLSIKDCATTALNFTAGMDTYIVVAPVPGYAYFTATVATGAQPTTFVGVPYPTYATNFGTNKVVSLSPVLNDSFMGPTVVNFNKFRYAALAAGLYPTSNHMQFAGSVSVWRADINLGRAGGSALQTAVIAGTILPVTLGTTSVNDVTLHKLLGTSSITPVVPKDNYTESFIKGAYTQSLDMTGDFEWQEFLTDGTYYSIERNTDNTPVVQFQADQTSSSVAGGHPLTGWGNLQSIIIKVSTPTGAVNSANLKVWNCLEMQVNTNSNLYQFSGVSPSHDPVALELYAKIRNELPIAVPCAMNPDYWQRVLRIIRVVLGAASRLPGPVGMIAGGVHALM